MPAEDDAPRPELHLRETEHDYQLRLFTLISLGEHEKLRQLVRVGADVNLPDHEGRPPLLFAAMHGQAQCVEALLQLGADMNGRDRLGNTALHVAARAAHAEIATLVLARSAGSAKGAGADVDVQSYAGRTPLHLAAAAGSVEVVELLCEAGCTLDSEVVAPHTPDDGRTAEQLAEGQSKRVGDKFDDCVDEIARVRRERGVVEEPEDDAEVAQMKASLGSLQQRTAQLKASIETKEREIAEQVQLSQDYVKRSEAIAAELGAATTSEQLDTLSAESNQVVEAAGVAAKNITLRKAEAAGLRAELARTNSDAVEAIRSIADIEARA